MYAQLELLQIILAVWRHRTQLGVNLCVVFCTMLLLGCSLTFVVNFRRWHFNHRVIFRISGSAP